MSWLAPMLQMRTPVPAGCHVYSHEIGHPRMLSQYWQSLAGSLSPCPGPRPFAEPADPGGSPLNMLLSSDAHSSLTPLLTRLLVVGSL